MKINPSAASLRISGAIFTFALIALGPISVRAQGASQSQSESPTDELTRLRQENERLRAENAALRAAAGQGQPAAAQEQAAAPAVPAPGAAPAAPSAAGEAAPSGNVPVVSNPNSNPGEVVELSKFEVLERTDNSYVVDTATAGLKTRQSLMDVPNEIQIVPRSLIDDMGISFATSDIARYVSAGVNSFGTNNQYYMRGQLVGRQFKDGIQYTPSEDDSFNIETAEAVKGLESTLFGSLPISQGMLIITRKVPLPVEQNEVRFLYNTDDSGGQKYRTEIDSTGPIPQTLIGNAKFSYRINGMWQDTNNLFHAVQDDDRYGFAPSLQIDWGNTTFRFMYEFQRLHDADETDNDFLNQYNQVSTIGGRFQTYKAPWADSFIVKNEYEVDMINRFTANFEHKLEIGYNRERRRDITSGGFLAASPTQAGVITSVVIPVTPASYFISSASYLKQLLYNWTVNDDYLAYWHVANSEQQTNFGWSVSNIYSNNVSNSPTFPLLGLINVVHPVFYPLPPINNTTVPGSAGDVIGETGVGSAYVQDQAHLFGDHLIATLGFNWGYNLAISHTNIPTALYQDSKGSALTHNAALVYKVNPHISLFGLQATSFVPQSAGIADANGKPLPSITSEDHEGGVKLADLFGGLLSGSFDAFYLKTDHQNISFNPGNGQPSYNLDAGVTLAKGFEYEARLHPLPHTNWDIIGTLYHGNGNISSAVGTYVFRGYKYTWSGLTKYTFDTGPVKGLSLGLNMFHMGDVYVRPGPVYPKWDVWGAFLSYAWSHFVVELTGNNLLNELYVSGGLSRYAVTPGLPRNVETQIRYKF